MATYHCKKLSHWSHISHSTPYVIKWVGHLKTSQVVLATHKCIWLTTLFTIYVVKTCVAAGCSNTNKDGVSIHSFPGDPALKKKLVDQVKRHMQGQVGSPQNILCSVLALLQST